MTNVSPRALHSHLEFIVSAGFSLIPLRGLADGNPENSVCLTFDDGYASFYDEVLPTLQEFNTPATLFIINNFVGRYNDWDVTFGLNRRRHLDWKQIEDIANAGIEIGSHGCSHHDLTRLSKKDLREELQRSKSEIEDHIGKEVTSLALPFGQASAEVFSAARELGYMEICGKIPGWFGPFPGVLPRVPVYRGDGVNAIRRKLDMNFFEMLRLKTLQGCSRGTRLVKK